VYDQGGFIKLTYLNILDT